MKRTPDDDAFIKQFAPALRQKYQKAKEDGMSDQVFAESIGVERISLSRYLDGESMPSVRTIAFAYSKYRISIPYKRVSLQNAIPKKGRRPMQEKQSGQLILPFTVQTENVGTNINLKLDSASAGKIEFRLIIDRAV